MILNSTIQANVRSYWLFTPHAVINFVLSLRYAIIMSVTINKAEKFTYFEVIIIENYIGK